MNPKTSSSTAVELLGFGRALGSGRVSEQEYYDFIIKRFQYPHPAYQANWEEWRRREGILFPFLFLLQLLDALYTLDTNEAYLTKSEILNYAYVCPNHTHAPSLANEILCDRSQDIELVSLTLVNGVADKINRKINDITAFLCMSGYTYIRSQDSGIALNLIGRHPAEKTFFHLERNLTNHQKINQLTETIRPARFGLLSFSQASTASDLRISFGTA